MKFWSSATYNHFFQQNTLYLSMVTKKRNIIMLLYDLRSGYSSSVVYFLFRKTLPCWEVTMRFNSARLVLYQIDNTQRSARAQIVEKLSVIIFFFRGWRHRHKNYKESEQFRLSFTAKLLLSRWIWPRFYCETCIMMVWRLIIPELLSSYLGTDVKGITL